MKDVIIVGAGISGLYLSKILEKNGINPVIFEMKKRRKIKCSGLISKNIKLFFRIKNNVVENKIRKAVIKVNESSFTLKKPYISFYVINRIKMEKEIENSLNIQVLKEHVNSIKIEKDYVKVLPKRIKSRLVVGADGANSTVARSIGVKKNCTLGIFGIVKKNDYSDEVNIYINKKINHDGFFWRIPRGEKVEYGMLSKKANFKILESFFKTKLEEKHAHIIPIQISRKLCTYRTILVGDAAGLNKPWSGGGVIYSMLSSLISSYVIKTCLENSNFNTSMYSKLIMKTIGRRIKISGIIKKMIDYTNNSTIKIILGILRILNPMFLDEDMLNTATKKLVKDLLNNSLYKNNTKLLYDRFW